MQFLRWHRSIPGLRLRPPNNPKFSVGQPTKPNVGRPLRSVAALVRRAETVLPVPVRHSARLAVRVIRVRTVPLATKRAAGRRASRASTPIPVGGRVDNKPVQPKAIRFSPRDKLRSHPSWVWCSSGQSQFMPSAFRRSAMLGGTGAFQRSAMTAWIVGVFSV